MHTLSHTHTHTQSNTRQSYSKSNWPARPPASRGVMRVNLPYKLPSKHTERERETRIKLNILYILYEFNTLHIRANELINQLQLPLQLHGVYGKYAKNYNQFKAMLIFLTCWRLTIFFFPN